MGLFFLALLKVPQLADLWARIQRPVVSEKIFSQTPDIRGYGLTRLLYFHTVHRMRTQSALRASAGDEQHLAALRTYWKALQTFPSMAKLAAVVGLAHASSVFQLVGRLVEAGYLERVEGRIAPSKRFFARPVWGPVRAGVPQTQGQEQEQEDVLSLDDYLIDNASRTGLVTVRGDSMKDAGLLDGDLVCVESNTATKSGDIVVAVVDGEMTVKTLRLSKTGRYYLEAANPAFADIHPQGSLEIIGVVVSSCRRIRR